VVTRTSSPMFGTPRRLFKTFSDSPLEERSKKETKNKKTKPETHREEEGHDPLGNPHRPVQTKQKKNAVVQPSDLKKGKSYRNRRNCGGEKGRTHENGLGTDGFQNRKDL